MSAENESKSRGTSPLEKWEEAHPLETAWYTCADRAEERQYSTTEDDARREYLRFHMKRDLLSQLATSKMSAFGLREGSPPEQGPVQIPSYLFPTNVNDQAEVDWGASSVTSAGHKFVSVRVLKESVISPLEPLLPLQRKDAPFDAPKRKPGPPSGFDAVVETYERMMRAGSLAKGMTTKEMHRAMLPELARKRDVFPNGRGLKYSSIARHLHRHLVDTR